MELTDTKSKPVIRDVVTLDGLLKYTAVENVDTQAIRSSGTSLVVGMGNSGGESNREIGLSDLDPYSWKSYSAKKGGPNGSDSHSMLKDSKSPACEKTMASHVDMHTEKTFYCNSEVQKNPHVNYVNNAQKSMHSPAERRERGQIYLTETEYRIVKEPSFGIKKIKEMTPGWLWNGEGKNEDKAAERQLNGYIRPDQALCNDTPESVCSLGFRDNIVDDRQEILNHNDDYTQKLYGGISSDTNHNHVKTSSFDSCGYKNQHNTAHKTSDARPSVFLQNLVDPIIKTIKGDQPGRHVLNETEFNGYDSEAGDTINNHNGCGYDQDDEIRTDRRNKTSNRKHFSNNRNSKTHVVKQIGGKKMEGFGSEDFKTRSENASIKLTDKKGSESFIRSKNISSIKKTHSAGDCDRSNDTALGWLKNISEKSSQGMRDMFKNREYDEWNAVMNRANLAKDGNGIIKSRKVYNQNDYDNIHSDSDSCFNEDTGSNRKEARYLDLEYLHGIFGDYSIHSRINNATSNINKAVDHIVKGAANGTDTLRKEIGKKLKETKSMESTSKRYSDSYNAFLNSRIGLVQSRINIQNSYNGEGGIGSNNIGSAHVDGGPYRYNENRREYESAISEPHGEYNNHHNNRPYSSCNASNVNNNNGRNNENSMTGPGSKGVNMQDLKQGINQTKNILSWISKKATKTAETIDVQNLSKKININIKDTQKRASDTRIVQGFNEFPKELAEKVGLSYDKTNKGSDFEKNNNAKNREASYRNFKYRENQYSHDNNESLNYYTHMSKSKDNSEEHSLKSYNSAAESQENQENTLSDDNTDHVVDNGWISNAINEPNVWTELEDHDQTQDHFQSTSFQSTSQAQSNDCFITLESNGVYSENRGNQDPVVDEMRKIDFANMDKQDQRKDSTSTFAGTDNLEKLSNVHQLEIQQDSNQTQHEAILMTKGDCSGDNIQTSASGANGEDKEGSNESSVGGISFDGASDVCEVPNSGAGEGAAHSDLQSEDPSVTIHTENSNVEHANSNGALKGVAEVEVFEDIEANPWG